MPEIEIPVDDMALDQMEHAIDGAFTLDEGGNHILVGADYTLNQLLQFWSGYDPADSHLEGHIEGTPLYVHTKPILHTNDVIRALITEIRRLRENNG